MKPRYLFFRAMVLILVSFSFFSAQADILHGNQADNTLQGSNRADVIYGDGGTDTLTGGGGADVFVFELPSAFESTDFITDYLPWEDDAVDISALLQNATAEDNPEVYIRLVVDTDKQQTTLYIDRDGTGGEFDWHAVAVFLETTDLEDIPTLIVNDNLIISRSNNQ